eukprot:m.116356 g.116356  ORF g.116356 m.116356 type:complete len:645 (+) comp16073_c0_seq1:81-2015(+)
MGSRTRCVAVVVLVATLALAWTAALGNAAAVVEPLAVDPLALNASGTLTTRGVVFASLSTEESVSLFGTEMPTGGLFISDAGKCAEGRKVTEVSNLHGVSPSRTMTEQQTQFGGMFCLFDSRIKTRALHSILQSVRCEHPPEDVRESLVGKPVTIMTSDVICATSATYSLPSPSLPPRGGEPKHYLCSCLTMWQRADALMEWVRYHYHLMGVTKLFIYDNESHEDKLAEKVRWMQNGYDIDYIYWPEQRTQYAFKSHCMLAAQGVCEWLTTTDVDEFPFIMDPKIPDGRLDTWLKTKPDNVGALSLSMQPIIDGGCHLKTPPGGVMKNYHCQPKTRMSKKHILRPLAIHPSLMTTVHDGCYKQGYKTEIVSEAKVVLKHYTLQSWQEVMKKYQRRAGPKSKWTFAEVAADKPSGFYMNMCHYCKHRRGAISHAIENFYLCKSSLKHAGAKCKDGRLNAKLLITGTGGDGSALDTTRKILAPLIEGADSSVSVSWESVMLDDSLNTSDRRFAQVFHQVQDPLVAIPALVSLPESTWAWIEKHTPIVRAADQPLRRALYHWVTWNQFIESLSDVTYRAETIASKQICKQLAKGGIDIEQLNASDLMTSPVTPTTWDALEAVDPLVASMAKNMAIQYGYSYDATNSS